MLPPHSGHEWGHAYFTGAWTMEELVAFMRRVAEIQDAEREKAASDE